MCDTIYVPANRSQKGVPLFGKNSDRDPNEAHLVEFHPKKEYSEGETVKCTYLTIPQAKSTNAIILARPFWIWGGEMGANEFGVTIGNEAVFTRIPYVKGDGLTGMDLLRLGLERSRSALEAVKTITALLEEFGQGGNCGFLHKFYYHNSFLIADPKDAWVLETAGKQWAAEHVTGIRTISNAITIDNKWDMASDNLVKYAVDRRWCKNEADFSFSSCYSDPLITYFGDAKGRQSCTTLKLTKEKNNLDARDMMAMLRTHRRGDASTWAPDRGFTGADVCMHAAVGPIRINETTGSMVSELGENDQLHWFTGTAAPCTGIFKPVWFKGGLPDLGQIPTGKYDTDSLWWTHEKLHRSVIMDYNHRMGLYRNDRDTLEGNFIQKANAISNLANQEKLAYSQACFDDAKTATIKWMENIDLEPVRKGVSALYKKTREKFDKLAMLPYK
jgi:dipeptidase